MSIRRIEQHNAFARKVDDLLRSFPCALFVVVVDRVPLVIIIVIVVVVIIIIIVGITIMVGVVVIGTRIRARSG